MTSQKYTMVTLISMITLLIIFIYSFAKTPTKVYADNISEAQVTTSTAQATTTQVTTRQAPVSIAVYSNEITESSDTYNYNKNVNAITVDTSGQKTTVAATAAPAVSSTDTVTATQVPQTTASPGATPEPDIITYPPTVAPAYTD